MNHTHVIAFAKALDHDDFNGAAQYVTHDCLYDSPSGQLVGAKPIMDSYAKNAAWARKAFDALEFKSDVVMTSPKVAEITYTDITQHAGMDHVYQCQQIVELNNDGLICNIRHQEIPGQHEALEAFLEKAGVKRG